ncbi:MAG: hypothetical protein KZQ75_08565 [Candidatus Thiodiazotropha sp. (ex Myrtea spinifera)]|nr:hypothetical protein [Candidatus Thiodiazotropha sp. (ex Myrtea spinifera)]MCU7830344.1 hypothetical protein [Candidatus Thiodiazotropha sp. (ex Myrtea sp. 'scaly one' KF741663)]
MSIFWITSIQALSVVSSSASGASIPTLSIRLLLIWVLVSAMTFPCCGDSVDERGWVHVLVGAVSLYAVGAAGAAAWVDHTIF